MRIGERNHRMKPLLETKDGEKDVVNEGYEEVKNILSLYVTHKSTKTIVIKLEFDIVHKLSRSKLK